jgi:hypothetical protein
VIPRPKSPWRRRAARRLDPFHLGRHRVGPRYAG